MSRLALVFACIAASISILIAFPNHITSLFNFTNITSTTTMSASKSAISKAAALSNAVIRPHRSATRGHSDHGWLNTYHSFSFADWHDPTYMGFGSLRVLNEDRVAPGTGFPTHTHRDFEIFSYILSGELTHRDSMLAKNAEGGPSDRFSRMRRGDVQFTTGGSGIAHSEFNEHESETVHFLQIWATPWKRGIEPRYQTMHFSEDAKREGFVTILSPMRGGPDASADEEKAAIPTAEDTIPIHADLAMGAGLLAKGAEFGWVVGGNGITQAEDRKVFVHLAMTQAGTARVRLDGREDAVLNEGDGAFVDGVKRGDILRVESVGEGEAEVVVLDTA